MKDIDKYSKSTLEAYKIYHVVNYQRQDKSYGITTISFDLLPGKHLHWISFLTFGIFTPVCLVVNGVQLVASNGRKHYFDTASGQELGRYVYEVAHKCNLKGFEFFNKKKFSDAKDWFNKAYQICEVDHYNEESYRNNRDATNIVVEAQDLFNQERFVEAGEKFGVAKSLSTNETIQTLCKQIRKNCARALYEQGKKSWNEAWDAENDDVTDRSEEAKKKFLKAVFKFTEASKLARGTAGKLYKKWSEICGLKIDGNKLFNVGFQLQEQGDKLRDKTKYEEACAKYGEAKKKFKEGFLRSEDERFQACITLVEESIEISRQALHKLNSDKLAKGFTTLTLSQTGSNIPEVNTYEQETQFECHMN